MWKKMVMTFAMALVLSGLQAQTFYLNNLRIAGYYIDDVGGGCSFDGESPDPRYNVNVTGDAALSVVLNPGDDKDCGWTRLDVAGLTFPSGSYAITGSDPLDLNFGVASWEEDGCGDDNTYNDDCFTNDDDYPASTSQLVSLSLAGMTLGYNSRELTWQGSGKEYGLRLEWDLAAVIPVVAMYADANFQGRAQGFAPGDYRVNSLFTGVGNDNISSMQIPAGYKVVAYNNDNFEGYPIEFRGNVSHVGGPNDRISSFKVVPDSPSPTGKKLLIYFNGSGKSIGYQMERFATNIRADQMIFIKGVGGDSDNYDGYNQNGIQHQEAEELYQYDGFDVGNPFPTTFYSTVNAFKNSNNGGADDHYVFGVDMDYDGGKEAGYEDEDSYVAASNVMRVLRRYNLRDYDTIVISGHSRGSAVGIASFLYGIQKAKQGDAQFVEFQPIINDVFDNANVINVVALDPVAGSPLLPNDFHMGATFRMREIYAWLKTQFPNRINFTELYANGGRMLEADELAGLGGYFSSSTFDPSPNYLHIDASNNVHRYWLGYRHSTMVNKSEKWTDLYDNAGLTRPWLLTADLLNAALENQPRFRDFSYWHNTFRSNDQGAWFAALKTYGCSPSFSEQNGDDPLDNPDADLEFRHYHGTRHTTFPNSDNSTVDMRTFVPSNTIPLDCNSEYLPPRTPGLKTASNSHTVNGWTYYCTCEGELLLALSLDGTGANVPPASVSVQVDAAPSPGTGSPSNIVPDGLAFAELGRSWFVQPSADVSNGLAGIRLVYAEDDKNQLADLVAGTLDATEMRFFRSTAHSAHESVSNITTGDVYIHASDWLAGVTEGGFPYAQINLSSFGASGSTLGAWAATCPSSDTLYVDANAGTPGKGSSWATAMQSLSEALRAAHLCSDITTIVVAQGTYYPTRFPYAGGVESTEPDARYKTFHLRSGLTLLGGYNAATGQRDIAAHPTVLSGDIGVQGSSSDNALHVVLVNEAAQGTTTIDGVTIKNGNANDASHMTGGGLYATAGANTIVRNAHFTQNYAGFSGGAVRYEGGIHAMTNSILDYNTCDQYASVLGTGGGSQYTWYNNTLANNASNGGSGLGTAIYHFNSTGSIKNTIFYNNTQSGDATTTGADIIDGSSGLTIEYSLLQPNNTAFAPSGSNNNLIANPQFTNLATADYTLQAGSPAIDAGTAIGAPATDRNGTTRPQGMAHDLGAFEYSTSLPVTWAAFTGEVVHAYNKLYWTTATEENNAHFEVERSHNGLEWETIGQVMGQGTLLTPTDYTFLDRLPLAGTSYYRLAQVDFEGTTAYSQAISLHRATDQATAPIIYPNPMRNSLTIEYASGRGTIYSQLGQPVQAFELTQSPYTIDVSALPAGQYLLRIITDAGATYTQQLVK